MNGLNFDEPGSTEYINPDQLMNKLLIIFPIQHVRPAPPTKFSRADKVDDAISVDVVVLDMPDEQGQPKVFSAQLWRQAKLIQSFRQRIGGTLLGTLGKGTATMGQPPWIFISLTHEPEAVRRAEAWAAANPDFKPSQPREWIVQPQGQEPGGQPTGGQPPHVRDAYDATTYNQQQQPAHHGAPEQIPDWARDQRLHPPAQYQQQPQTPPLPPGQPQGQQSILERLAKQHEENPHLQGDQARQQYGY